MINSKKIFFGLLCLIGIHPSFSQQIIPQPLEVVTKTGFFSFNTPVAVYADEALTNEVDYLSTLWQSDFGVIVNRSTTSISTGILLKSDQALQAELGEEGYKLSVHQQGVEIKAATPTGIFYGIQSLRQLMKKSAHWQVQFQEIKDQPRFSWRSYMLDEGRYFKGKEVVKKILDEMALLKMNVFHWHLTEDQGWRLAIDNYPALTSIGGKRDSTQVGSWESKVYDGKVHQGYYSKEDVKEIIAYAASRHIQVVPEIEMPGHSSAAIAAYPWLGVTKKPISVPTSFGVKYDIFDVTDPKVISFLQEVLNEVIELFPSKVIHIGGDEVKYDQWLKSEKVQAYMRAHKLSSPADLQIAFTNAISNYIAGKNRQMMGWNDIMGAKLHDYNQQTAPVTGTLSKSTIVQFWKGELAMVKDAVSKGYHVVNSYHLYTYLDYDYKTIPLKKAYDFDPIPEGLDRRYHKQILGLGAQMWGEWIPSVQAMNQQTFPRIAAYAEVGWTSKANKDFDRFEKGLTNLYHRWDKKGIEYHKIF
ncbi:beta-N-acetylhexosaminidase [Olivibacter sp. CPCC 100613]|uniref:beta-N-acetylhexosaminidase n=1 Tax=Olivibacter sp. CPCC 100613 TaxID=3079931 RepID=UPI002FFBE882